MDHVGEFFPVLLERRGCIGIDTYHSPCLTGNGVGKIATVDLRKRQSAEFVEALPDKTGKLLVGVASAKPDLHSGMAALEMIDVDLIIFLAFKSLYLVERKSADCNLSSGASDHKLTMLL